MKLKKILSENTKLTEEQKQQIVHKVRGLNEYGKLFKHVNEIENALTEIQKTAHNAGYLAIQESDDWFETSRIKSDMREVAKCVKELDKVKEELKVAGYKAQSLYEDIGYKLGKYYEVVKDGDIDDDQKLNEKEVFYTDDKDRIRKFDDGK